MARYHYHTLAPHPSAVLHRKLCECSLVSSVGVWSDKNCKLMSCKPLHGTLAELCPLASIPVLEATLYRAANRPCHMLIGYLRLPVIGRYFYGNSASLLSGGRY